MRYLLVIFLGLFILSCDSSRLYEDFNNMEEAFWHKDSIQSFRFTIEDTVSSYNLIASFRNASSYPFYNLYFQYTLTDSLDRVLQQELKEIYLFDSKTGEPYGNGLGDLFDHTYSLSENYQFENPGTYSIHLQQFMRLDTLPYLVSVGARVEYAVE